MYDNSNLRSLNECNIRPRRTSYSHMSTWFFMDKKSIDTSRHNAADYLRDYYDDEYFERRSIPSPRKVCEAPVVRDFLMKNWSNEKCGANSLVDKDLDLLTNKGKRKGRSGSGGSWMNITQANQDDGKQLLFINNRIASTLDPPPPYSHPSSVSYSKSSISNNETPRLTYSGRRITKAYLEKLERERRGVQTKHGVENGHWKIIR